MSHAAYYVIASDISGMEVGTILLDNESDHAGRVWTAIDTASPDSDATQALGAWLVDLCATCRAEHQMAGLVEHDGPCGSDGVKVITLATINTAVAAVS